MTAYGNPKPYASPGLERAMIEGRITAARKISKVFEDQGQTAIAAKWSRIADELLDHLAEVDARAVSAAMDESLR